MLGRKNPHHLANKASPDLRRFYVVAIVALQNRMLHVIIEAAWFVWNVQIYWDLQIPSFRAFIKKILSAAWTRTLNSKNPYVQAVVISHEQPPPLPAVRRLAELPE